MKAVREYYDSLGDRFTEALNEMLIFDALICNTDRHFGNFGFMIDSRSNTITSPAPLFDHDNSLFNFAGSDDLESDQSLDKYAQSLLPCVYDDFIGTAKSVLTKEYKEKIRKLFDFRFKRNIRYNLDDKRLSLIERQIQKRAQIILE